MSPLFTLSISWRWRLPSQSSLLTNEPLSSDKFSVCIRMCQDVSGGASLGQGFQGQDGHWQTQTSEICVMRLQGSACYFNFGDGVITQGSMSVTASQGPALCLLKFFAAASSSMSHRQGEQFQVQTLHEFVTLYLWPSLKNLCFNPNLWTSNLNLIRSILRKTVSHHE